MGSPISTGTILSPRKYMTRLVVSVVLCLFLFYYSYPATPYWSKDLETQIIHVHYNSSQQQQQRASLSLPSPPLPSSSSFPYTRDCSLNRTRLQILQKQYGLGDSIDYAKRYIRFQRLDITRLSITKINDTLFPQGLQQIDIQNSPLQAQCASPLVVPVSKSAMPESINASDFLFGVSTTYSRITDPNINPMKEWAHWLTDGKENSNGARLVLRLVDASDKEIMETQSLLISMGIDAKVQASDSSIPMAKRYLSLLPSLYEDNSRLSRKWLVICDDDTFFPSMQRLINRLSEYDDSEPLYIGTFSEDVNNIQRHGSQAFGGAGVFFTVSLASQIAKLYPSCSTNEKIEESNTGWGPQGDILLRKCIYENTEVRLTMLRDLHQLDIMGDPSGFYESGIAPLSLHHFKGGMWHNAKPYTGVQVIHTCGEDCFLQRFKTEDNFIISNGYSVAHYPHGINFNVHQMERTFTSAPDDYGWNLDFMLEPGRRSLHGTGRKIAWDIKDATRESDGSVSQIYIRKNDDIRWTNKDGDSNYQMMNRDGIVELVWIP
ncbi:putative glycosyltransferase family 31 protein [Erysiphe neolycopersici]|uniref:Putative glycosyltransferase family 31 protein n=1 Tax=Erysiphe neolycopersici TaxID=212602 RepID=A0A420HWZ2_9PEZI|nr:putative glycosyltransferase family 31 protein [Erysiphe neolycopersici]